MKGCSPTPLATVTPAEFGNEMGTRLPMRPQFDYNAMSTLCDESSLLGKNLRCIVHVVPV